MIGLDTNIIIRFTTGEGEGDEVERARAIIDGLTPRSPGLISHLVLIETWWVLGSAYGRDAFERCDLIEKMLQIPTLRVQEPDIVRRCLAAVRTGADLPDALIAEVARSLGATKTLTFDKKAAKRAGMGLAE